jgi:hypothetical protein
MSSITTKKSIQVGSEKSKKMVDHIPCLYLPYEEGADKLVLYFHGNAEDIGLAFDLVYLIG